MEIHYIATIGKNIRVTPILKTNYNNNPLDDVSDPISFGFFKFIEIKHTCKCDPIKITLIHTSDEDSIHNTKILIDNFSQITKNVNSIVVRPFDSEEVVHTIMKMNLENQKIILNITSGTNPMHAGMWRSGLNLLEQNKPVTILYIKEFKNNKIIEKGNSSTMELLEIETDSLLARNYFEQGYKSFSRGNYSISSDLFALASIGAYDAILSTKGEAFKNLSLCYCEWDNFNHITINSDIKAADYYLNEAIRCFKKIKYQDKEANEWLLFLEDKRLFFTEELKSYISEKNHYYKEPFDCPPPHIFHVFDSYQGACIKISQKKYMDALIRAYRTIDMLLEYHVWVKYKIQTKKSNLSSFLSKEQKDLFVKTLSELSSKQKVISDEELQNYGPFSSQELIALLRTLNDSLYLLLDKYLLNYKTKKLNGEKLNLFINYLRKRRNSCHLTHGLGQYSRIMKLSNLEEPCLFKMTMINIQKLLKDYTDGETYKKYNSIVQRGLSNLSVGKLDFGKKKP